MMNWKIIFNPFLKFTEKQLLIFGLLFFFINGLVCYYAGIKMDSIFHFSPMKNSDLTIAFFYCGFSIVFAVIVLFILGIIFNNKTRLIDILNAVLISQVFNFPTVLAIKFIDLEKISGKAMQNLQLEFADMLLLLVFVGITLPFIIYGIVLLYNGFRTATNIKSWKQIAIFAVVLFILLPVCQSISYTLKF